MPADLSELLASQTASQPDQAAYTFLRDDLSVSAQLTYRELETQVRRIAGRIAGATSPGQRVLLVYGPGLDFVCAFWACAYAGVVAIPTATSESAGLKTMMARLRKVAQDADTSLVLTTSRLRDRIAAQTQEEADCWQWIASDEESSDEPLVPGARRWPLAYLQYTSGSTSAPKGVMVSHANVLANCAAFSEGVGLRSESRMLSWLPHFHDYGLVHGILMPIYMGARAVLMSPLTFLRRPLRWLEAVDRFRITHTGAPNFAYAACVQALTSQRSWSTDLSCLENAGCGAEPINPRTIQDFHDVFAPYGLSRHAFAPAYGLAETTLGATAKRPGTEARTIRLRDTALQAGRVEPCAADAPDARELVSCGRPVNAVELRIVDPQSGQLADAGEIGEIWIASPSNGTGYWQKPEATRETFGALLSSSPGRTFLRTGDLGFLDGGELFVTGRLKDLLIVHGRNVYPQDIEWTVEHADAALRVGHGAALSIEGPEGEQLIIIQEVRRDASDADLDSILGKIRKAVADEHDLPVHTLALLRAGSVPRTTSGKIQRRSCKQKFLTGELDVLRISQPVLAAAQPSHSAAHQDHSPATLTELRALASRPKRLSRLEQFIAECVARLTHRDRSSVLLTVTPIEAGLDSLTTFALLHEIQSSFGVSLSPAAVLDVPSLRAIAERVLERLETGAADVDSSASGTNHAPQRESDTRNDIRSAPATVPQRGVWVAESLAGASAVYNLVYAVRIKGPLRVAELERALQTVVDRHAVLRTAFESHDGELFQVIHPRVLTELPSTDLSDRPLAEREAQLQRLLLEHARPPFDLTRAPLWRPSLFQLDESEHVLLLVLHHLVYDGWSHSILMRELGAIYAAFVGGQAPSPRLHLAEYAEYVQSRDGQPTEAQVQEQLAYWKERLAGLQPTQLPTDHPRRPRPGVTGEMVRFAIPAERVAQLKALARSENATLYMVVLAAFQTLLMRYTGNEDISVGSPVAGRTRSRFRETLGFFSNTLVMRTDFSANPSFRRILAQVRETAVQAYAHQEVPTDRLITELNIKRDAGRNTLDPIGFALLALPDFSLEIAGTECIDYPLHLGVSRCDFSCALCEERGALRGEMEFRSELFERTTIERLAQLFQRMLGAVVATPDARVADLPLLEEPELRLVLDRNAIERDYPLDKCIHELFAVQARMHPSSPAVILGERLMTYAQLDEQANRLANRLRALGVGRDVPVGICLERSVEMMVALLATLKAGGAFLPLDPEYPEERLRFMLADSGARVVLTQQAHHTHVAGAVAAGASLLSLDSGEIALETATPDDPGVRCSPDDAAYLIYTSGSSGRPKGVINCHRGLTNLICWFVEELGLNPADRVLQKTSISFDASLPELFGPLLAGAPVVLAAPGEHRDFAHLARTIGQQRISVLLGVPSAIRALLEEPALTGCSSLRYVVIGGEPFDHELARDLCRRLPGITFGNFYGPTEAADNATRYVLKEPPTGPGTLPIGKPIPNVRCYVLDRHGNPIPDGVVGELYIGGAGVARGYLNRPALTAEKFCASPFRAGERLYRTGDLARYRQDGNIEFMGRADGQIKIRGFRVELGEIEAVLRAAPGVKECAVVAHGTGAADMRLYAYVAGNSPDITALYEEARSKLPAHLVPAAITPVAQLPLLPNGKVDRAALPIPQADAGRFDYVVPRGPIEQTLQSVWRDVLGIERIGAEDNFFELGGHSLLATQVVSRIRRLLHVEIPLRALFESPTIRGLARHIDEQRARSGKHIEPLIEPVSRERPLPVSFSQRRMWFMQQLEPAGTAYNMPFATRLTGALNRQALARALEILVARHEGFRTTFVLADGEPLQVIAPQSDAPLRLIDLRDLPEADRLERAAGVFREEALRPFDLARGPLFRFLLIQLGDADHAFLMLMHHSIGDQWSAGVIAQELVKVYSQLNRGARPSLESLRVQYADFATWQRRHLGGSALDEQLAHWREKLRGISVLALPTDRPRPARQTYHGSWVGGTLGPETLAALKKLSSERGATPFMTLLACFKIVLSRYCGQQDIAVGSPVANRNRLATENLVGTLVNTLVMRTSLEGDPSFGEFLARVRETALDAFAHQDVPFERLVEELGASRDASHSPLVQVLFNVPNAPMGDMAFEGVAFEAFDFDHGSAQFDLSLSAETELSGRIVMSYCTDLFERATVERMLAHYLHLVEQVVADPTLPVAEYRLVVDDELQMMTVEWNRTQAEYPCHRTAAELFAEQARRTPKALAVSMGNRRHTYAALESRANQLAHFLRAEGVDRGERVGVCLERSIDMVAALLAVMKAGGTYVPLDPAFPKGRLQFMAEDAGLKLTLTQTGLLETLSELSAPRVCIDLSEAEILRQPSSSPARTGDPSDVAYILYTSGSTGRPKGVEIPHDALTNFLWSMRSRPGCHATDTLLSITTLSFDISGLELYLPLIVGARVELASRADVNDPALLIQRMAECQPTIVQATPATWRMLLASGWTGAPRTKLLCGGEPLTRELADRLLDRCGELWNMYGPTETTIWSTLQRIERGSHAIDIGRPIANTSVYILDKSLQPVPIGAAGELYIGGRGVAHGYRGRSDLTEERFLPDPFRPGTADRIYRTGDLARYLPDGRIVHLGRLDMQVKIRGFRIELGEIESALGRHPGVIRTAVAAKLDRSGQQQLVGYIVARDGDRPSVESLRTALGASLPAYMIPSQFVFLQDLPLTASNKVDVNRLPEPDEAQAEPAAVTPAEPGNPLELQLLALWRRVLGTDSVGVHDNFFDLGGHSLKAVQLVAYIKQVYGKELPLATLIQAPTVALLARLLTESKWEISWRSLVAIQPSGSRIPLFAVPGVGGNVLVFAKLARLLGPDQPFYGLQARGVDGRATPFKSVHQAAAHYVREIRSVRPRGPYLVAGTCTGGVFAYEVAQQLHARGEPVELMILETWPPSSSAGVRWSAAALWPVQLIWLSIARSIKALREARVSAWPALLADKLRKIGALLHVSSYDLRESSAYSDRVMQATMLAVARYRPVPYAGGLLNVIASGRQLSKSTVDARRKWETLAQDCTHHAEVPAEDSGQMFVAPHVELLARHIATYVEERLASIGEEATTLSAATQTIDHIPDPSTG